MERITLEELVTQVMEMRDAELLQHENDERVVATRIPRMEGNGGRVLTWQLCGFGEVDWANFRGNERFHAYIDVTAEDIANMVAIVKEIANDIVSGEQKSKLEVAWLMGSSLANELENGENVGRYTSLDDSTPRIVVLSDDRRLLEEINRRLQVSSSLWKIRRSGRIDCQIMNDKGAMRVHEGARIVEPILISEANSRRVRYQRRAPQGQRSERIFDPVDGASDATAGNVIVDDSQLEASVDVILQAIERQFDDDASNARVEQITDLVDAPRYDHEFRYRGRARSGDRGQYFWETRSFGEQNVVAENNAEDVFRSYIRVPASLTGSAMEVLMDVVQEQIDANPEFSCGIRWLMGSYNERDGIQPGNYSELTVDMPQIVLYTGSQADMEEILTSLTADPRWGDIENAVNGMFEDVTARGNNIDCLADEYFNDGNHDYRSVSLFNRGGARNPHDLPLQNVRYTDTEGNTRIASDREVDAELAQLAQLRNSRAVARPSVPAPPAAVPVHAPVVVSPAIAATIPVGPPTPPLPPTAPIPPTIRPILPTIDTRVGLGNNKLKMAVPKELASQVFDGGTPLDQRIESSVAYYGGTDPNKQVENMSVEETALSKEVYTRHYLALKKRYESDPDSLTPEELVVAQIYQKIENGNEVTPKEQAKLYTALNSVEDRVLVDPRLQQELNLRTPAEVQEYKDKVWRLRGDVFYNLTGYDGSFAPPERSKYKTKSEYQMAVAQYRVERKDYVDMLIDKRMAGASHAIGVRRRWNRMRYGTAYGEFNPRWMFQDTGDREQEIKDLHWKRVYDGIPPTWVTDGMGQRLVAGKAGEASHFKPEVDAALAINAGLQRTRVEMQKFVSKNFISSDPNRNLFSGYILKINNPQAALNIMHQIETALGLPLGSTFSEQGKLGAFHPEKTTAESVTEQLWSEDMDQIARQALVRELPEEPAQLIESMSTYRDQIAEQKKKKAEAVKAKKNTEAKAAQDEIDRLEKKVAAIRLMLGAEKGRGPARLLSGGDPTYDGMATMLPADLVSEMEDYVAGELSIDSTKFAKGAARQKEINNQIKKQGKSKFSMAKMFMGFLGSQV